MNEYKKYCLIAEVHNLIYKNAAFSTGELGISLAYLTTAIVNDNICSLDDNVLLIQLLQILIPSDHLLWDFIKIEKDAQEKVHLVRCHLCDIDINIDDATYSSSLLGWLGKTCCLNKTIK